MRVQLFTRTYQPVSIPDSHAWQVQELTWSLPGGADRAVVEIKGMNVNQVEAVRDWLRCPLVVTDELGEPVWWGYLHGVESRQHGTPFRLSLDSLANRVAVRYTRLDGGVGGGTPTQTEWVDDAASGRTYGWKERLVLAGACSEAQAQALAGQILAETCQPSWEVGTAHSANADGMLLEGRGWWHTLGWRYASSAAGVEGHAPAGRGVQTLGSGSADARLAQSLTIQAGGWRAETAAACLRRVGVPTDNFRVELCADASGVPGSVLTSGLISGANLAPDLTWTKFALSPFPALATGSTVWLVLSRSGQSDAVNHFRVQVDEGLGYAGGALRVWNGSGWVARTPDADLHFGVGGGQETTRQITALAASSVGGQFLQGVRMETGSGVYSSPFQDGSRTALQVISRLLAAGTWTGLQLSAVVTPQRWLRVMALPEQPTVWLAPDGTLQDGTGRVVSVRDMPLGLSAHVAGSPPGAPPLRIRDMRWDRLNGMQIG